MAFAHGKVILLGEHAVVYGHPALAAAIDRGVEATATRGEASMAAPCLYLSPWDVIAHSDAAEPSPIERAFAALLAQYPNQPGLEVRANIALPGGAGLGCSAALGVAIVGAIDDLLGVTRSATERAERSLVWERIFHGNPSGVDSAISASGGGVAVFRRGEGLTPVDCGAPITLVVAHSHEVGETAAMVARVAEGRRAAPAVFGTWLDAVGAMVPRGVAAIERGDLAALGQVMDQNHACLRELGVSTDRLDRMCHVARRAGALGAKLTGSGGGGSMIALAAGRGAAGAIADALAAFDEAAFIARA